MGRTKGEAQKCIDATKGLSKFQLKSEFNDPQAITKWGWGISTDGTDMVSPLTLRHELYKFMTELKLEPQTHTAWATYKWRHAKAWEVGTDKGPVSWPFCYVQPQLQMILMLYTSAYFDSAIQKLHD